MIRNDNNSVIDFIKFLELLWDSILYGVLRDISYLKVKYCCNRTNTSKIFAEVNFVWKIDFKPFRKATI